MIHRRHGAKIREPGRPGVRSASCKDRCVVQSACEFIIWTPGAKASGVFILGLDILGYRIFGDEIQ